MGEIQRAGRPEEVPHPAELRVGVSHRSDVHTENSRRNRRWPSPKLSVPKGRKAGQAHLDSHRYCEWILRRG